MFKTTFEFLGLGLISFLIQFKIVVVYFSAAFLLLVFKTFEKGFKLEPLNRFCFVTFSASRWLFAFQYAKTSLALNMCKGGPFELLARALFIGGWMLLLSFVLKRLIFEFPLSHPDCPLARIWALWMPIFNELSSSRKGFQCKIFPQTLYDNFPPNLRFFN